MRFTIVLDGRVSKHVSLRDVKRLIREGKKLGLKTEHYRFPETHLVFINQSLRKTHMYIKLEVSK